MCRPAFAKGAGEQLMAKTTLPDASWEPWQTCEDLCAELGPGQHAMGELPFAMEADDADSDGMTYRLYVAPLLAAGFPATADAREDASFDVASAATEVENVLDVCDEDLRVMTCAIAAAVHGGSGPEAMDALERAELLMAQTTRRIQLVKELLVQGARAPAALTVAGSDAATATHAPAAFAAAALAQPAAYAAAGAASSACSASGQLHATAAQAAAAGRAWAHAGTAPCFAACGGSRGGEEEEVSSAWQQPGRSTAARCAAQ